MLPGPQGGGSGAGDSRPPKLMNKFCGNLRTLRGGVAERSTWGAFFSFPFSFHLGLSEGFHFTPCIAVTFTTSIKEQKPDLTDLNTHLHPSGNRLDESLNIHTAKHDTVFAEGKR